MKIKLEIWRSSGKWYTNETLEVENLEGITSLLIDMKKYQGMFCTTYIIEDDNHLQPYRMYKL